MQWVNFSLAIAGFGISLVLAIIRWKEFKSSQAIIDVKPNYGNPTIGAPEYRRKNLSVGIVARNRGKDIVVMDVAGLTLSDGSYLPWRKLIGGIGDNLPFELRGKYNCNVFFEISHIKKALKDTPDVYITEMFFQDKLGNRYICEPPEDLMSLIRDD